MNNLSVAIIIVSFAFVMIMNIFYQFFVDCLEQLGNGNSLSSLSLEIIQPVKH
ncbi:hypothetical protein RhiirC2_759294 [Rhizophagus irregularis]|uniref:Uncharacterized protein n=1 Tax=Rhizophagus irregularis TaxID=588596 RepID=A0A2N1MM03_9GLOM|nr:hypothetical protein RhiirC2_759294 [Rhizophagus irregularis]